VQTNLVKDGVAIGVKTVKGGKRCVGARENMGTPIEN
jgi:hypothetical protein